MAISRELPENIDWIDRLLDLALSSSDISATNQKLTLKILSCLQYIHQNKTLIALAVEMRLAKSPWWFEYREDTINDYELGILRDDNGTSFHIGYFKSPEEAIHLLSFKINELNQMLAQTPQSKWLQVIEKFGDGGTNGCLEARIRPAVDWMIQQLNNHHTLTHITTECEDLLVKQGKHDPSVQEVVRFILKYCHERGITACEQGNIDSALLTDYVKSLDLYREDNEEAIPKSPFHQLTATANRKIGYTGMIQYHYPTLDEANALVAWLKQQKELDTLNINKVSAKLEKDKYIVRVTQAQLDQINNGYQLEQQEIQTLADLFFQLSDDVTKNIGIQRNLLSRIASISPSVASQVLIQCSNNKSTPLHLAFQHASEPVLLALLAKASPDAINQALIVQNVAQWTPLHTAFLHASEPVLLALLTKASPKAINPALIMQNDTQLTPLHLAFRNASEPVLLALLTKASPEAINQALIVQNVAQWTPLYIAFQYASEPVLLALLTKASPEAINQALIVQSGRQLTPLYIAFHYASEPVLLALLAKASPDAINQALIVQSDTQWTPLHLAFSCASEPALLALLTKASPEAINQALIVQSVAQWTPLHLAFRNASEPVLLALLAKTSPDALSQASIMQNNNSSIPLDYLFSRTIPSCTLSLIDALPKKILDAILEKHLINLANIFENASPPLSFLIIETLITKCGIEAFCNFSIFNPIQRKYNPQYLIQLIFSSILKSEVVKYELPVFMLEALFNAFPSLKDLLFNRWAHNGKVSPSIEQYFLEKYLDPSVTTNNEAALTSEEDASQAIFKKIQANQVLIKMFSPQRWDILLTSLADYQYRAPLRDLASKSQATHKFFHATNEIKPYQPQKDYLKQYQATKKTPCTLLSQDMSGVLFGEKQANPSRIGLMFDANQCEMKTMLKYDRGTYSRGWLGSLEVVLSYQQQLVSHQLNFPDIASFQAHVNASSSINEVLACFTREAILCIAITDESLTTIHLAEKYQADILAKMNTTIPIMFYDREKGCVTDLQHTQEYLSRAKIRTLKETMQAKINWSKETPSVLGLTLFYKSNTPPVKAAEIIKLIEQQEAQPISWLQFEKQIGLSLNELTSTQPASRHDDTHSFYKSLQQVLS